MSHINLVNGQAHNESLVAQLVRAPNRYLGGHGFDSRQGLRIFLCPMLVSLWKKIIFIELLICQNFIVNIRDVHSSICKKFAWVALVSVVTTDFKETFMLIIYQVLPLFALIRNDGNQNTCGDTSKISVNQSLKNVSHKHKSSVPFILVVFIRKV